MGLTSPSRFTLVLLLLAVGALIGCQSFPAPTELPAIPPAPVSYNVEEPIDPSPTLMESATPAPTNTVRPTPRITQTPTAEPTRVRVPTHDLTALNEYQKGIAYIAIDNGSYLTASSDRSLDELFSTGANYISLLVTWYQKDIHSTEIHRTAETPSDDDLIHVIKYAHDHGVKVLLKPQLNFTDDTAHWRGEIAFADDTGWQSWFSSYLNFILTYARLAQVNGVEEFSVGTELKSASTHTENWRSIIKAVREVYTGLMTYSANHSGEEVKVQFWDDLDFIAINNFYHLTNYRNPTVAQLMAGWSLPLLQISRLHARFPKQLIIFTEVGYPSLDRANIWPWFWSRAAPTNLKEQANCYEALFRTFWKQPDKPWFRGLFIWDWLTDPNQGGPNNGDYTPHGKPAELVLIKYFASSTDSQQNASQ